MKTYTFFYFDNRCDFISDKRKQFVYSSSRFAVAFDAFLEFVVKSRFCYFTFINYYSVAGRHKTAQLRVFPSSYYVVLDKLRVLSDD